MKFKRTWILWAAVILLLPWAAFASGEGTVENAATDATDPEDEWTVLIYMCGSDLESRYSYATGNLEEISHCRKAENIFPLEAVHAGYTFKMPGQVNILIATGGTEEWHTQDLGMDTRTDCLQYWRYEPATGSDSRGNFFPEATRPLASMANPNTLTDFIQWGTGNYPAKKYCLVLWDHGGGSKTGIFIDELFEGDVMYLDELKAALENSGVRMNTVLFDACLMANLETAWAIHLQADWMVASEEIVAGKGTAIGDWLQQLCYVPDCDGKRLGRWICDMTAIKYANEDDEQAQELMTWSVTDLSKIDELAEHFDLFFQMVDVAYEKKPEVLSNIVRSVCSPDFYGSGNENMYDLACILYERVFNEIADPAAHWRMIDAITEAVPYCLHGSGRPSARGLSFCYGTNFSVKELETYSHNCPSGFYLAMLDAISPWTAPDWVYEKVPRLPEMETIDAYKVKVNKIVYSDGTPAFSLVDGYELNVNRVRYKLYRLNGETGQTESIGTAAAYLDKKTDEKGIYRIYDLCHWPAIDGTICQIELLTDYLNETYDSLMNIPIQINDKVWDLRCGFTGRDMSYTVYGLWEGFDSESDMFNRNVKTLAQFAGQEYQLLYEQYRDPATGKVFYSSSEPRKMTRSLKVEEVVLPEGEYEIEFVIDDLFKRSMSLGKVGMEWDGNTMKIRTEGWEGTETLDFMEYYAEDN